MKLKPFVLGTSACLLAAGGLWWWAQSSAPPENTSPSASAAEARPLKAREETEEVTVADLEDQSQWLHPSVKTLIGISEMVDDEQSPVERTYLERYRALHSLSYNLGSIDHQALMVFMNGERPTDCDLGSWHEMVDVIINILRRQNEVVTGFTSSLVRLYYSSDDPVLKDYALQYLRARFTDRNGFHQHETDPELCEVILDTLFHAASQLDRSYSGTALMGLDAIDSSSALYEEPLTRALIEKHFVNFDRVLVNAATNNTTDMHCRISALQVCAMRGLTEILPAARTLAADSSANPNVRISAIAAIGQLGSLEEDEMLLKEFVKSGNRFAHAAKPALMKLSQQ